MVGVYALLRVLPSLLGMVVSAGLPGAVAYFLAGSHRHDRKLPLTVVAMALGGGVMGAGLWAAATPLLGPLFFPTFRSCSSSWPRAPSSLACSW